MGDFNINLSNMKKTRSLKFKVNLGSLNWQTVYESTDSNIAYNIFLNKFN